MFGAAAVAGPDNPALPARFVAARNAVQETAQSRPSIGVWTFHERFAVTEPTSTFAATRAAGPPQSNAFQVR
jgi:hypothetical protein